MEEDVGQLVASPLFPPPRLTPDGQMGQLGVGLFYLLRTMSSGLDEKSYMLQGPTIGHTEKVVEVAITLD